MAGFNFYYQNSLVNQKLIKKYQKKLQYQIQVIKQELRDKYDTKYAFLNLPFDLEMIREAKKTASKLNYLGVSLFVQIGIGGSKLGAVAVFESIKGLYYNEQGPKCKYYAIDTIDQDLIDNIKNIIKQEFKLGGKVALAIVTKSGSTMETIVNTAIIIELLKEYYIGDRYKDYVYVITDKYSRLYDVAIKDNYKLLTIPKLVGGRYSVLSHVGLFPLALFDIDIEGLCDGARNIQDRCLDINIASNPAAISAAIIYEQINNGKNILDTFLFSPSLRMLGEWYRQLIGESLGKRYNLDNIKIETGITPTVSIGTTDLHSVIQLYLGGPRDKMTTFVNYIEDNLASEKSFIPNNIFSELIPVLKSHDVDTLKTAIFQGVLESYKNDNRPYVCISLRSKNSYDIGQFIMMKMMEVVYLGCLLNINPFDQPEVEIYKKNAKKKLFKYNSYENSSMNI